MAEVLKHLIIFFTTYGILSLFTDVKNFIKSELTEFPTRRQLDRYIKENYKKK